MLLADKDVVARQPGRVTAREITVSRPNEAVRPRFTVATEATDTARAATDRTGTRAKGAFDQGSAKSELMWAVRTGSARPGTEPPGARDAAAPPAERNSIANAKDDRPNRPEKKDTESPNRDDAAVVDPASTGQPPSPFLPPGTQPVASGSTSDATGENGAADTEQDRLLQSGDEAEAQPDTEEPSAQASELQGSALPLPSAAVPPLTAASAKAEADKGGKGNGPATAAVPGDGTSSSPVSAGSGQAQAAVAAAIGSADGPAVEVAGPVSDVPVAPVAGEFAALVDALAPPTPDGTALAAPGLGAASTTATNAPASTGPAPMPHQGPPVPLGGVPMTIGLRSLSGSSHFEIRLDPVDLGRIDVSLDIDKDAGTVTTRLVVDRPETLALLQRDAGNLQQALSQAGLDPSAGGISLSLRGDGPADGRGSDGRNPDGRDGSGRPGATGSESTAQPTASDYVAPRMLRGIAGIDIRI